MLWPSGAAIIAPSDPDAETQPSTRLRTCALTALDAAAIAMAVPVLAIAMPISTPPPSTIAHMLWDVASSTRPTI